LTGRIEASNGTERDSLLHLRQQLTDFTSLIDQQTQAVLQRATETLRVILNSQDIDAAIRPRLDQIDDTFLAVLQANIQQAEKAGETQTLQRLQQILDRVLQIIRDSAPPQLQVINAVMTTETDEEAEELIVERAPEFGPELLDLMDAVAADLDESEQPDAAARMRRLADLAAEHVGDVPRFPAEQHHHDHDH
jgi:hypothetical protein